ncbi:hypothetical protein BJF93_00120 [Xaviernesmea oryzae]|uniref:Transglutaminase n=2 Tax=Xaviernesmea oryzae TaxID=464029 RepID=A0A1Q9B082_9HYPH|nr:hypothetical protein BJF93_00120 [Xaviernesmea oryzae]
MWPHLRRLILPILSTVILLATHQPMHADDDDNDSSDDDRLRHVLLEYKVNADLTMESWSTIDSMPIRSGHRAENTRRWQTYSPATEMLEVAEAWVTSPDGVRHTVPSEDIFTRSAPQPSNMPGFNADQKITVVFPQVGPGSKVHVKWHRLRKTPQLFGVNILETARYDQKVEDTTIILDVPSTIDLQWYADPGVETEEHIADNRRIIRAHMTNIPKLRLTYPTVSEDQFRPRFMATTLKRLEDEGDRILAQVQDDLDPATADRIAKLARSIVGDRQGLEAAAAIHDWIRQNIAYTAVYLNPNDGWVEHPIGKILDNGFGDCKDQTALMRALLGAVGIRAERAVVQWGTLYDPLPLPVAWQFNHAMVYLPDFNLFDNPTDKRAPFAALDEQLINKQALIVSRPSRVIRLPDASPDLFRISNRSELVLGPDGTVTGQAMVHVSPWLVAQYQQDIDSNGPAALLTRKLAINGQDGQGRLSVIQPKTWRDDLLLKANWMSAQVVDLVQKTIVLPLQTGFDTEPLVSNAPLLHDDVTVAPFRLMTGTLDWSVAIKLPLRLKVQSVPPPVHIDTEAGLFDSRVEEKDGTLLITRRLINRRLVTKPDDYLVLKTLLRAVVRAGRSYAILTRETEPQHG